MALFLWTNYLGSSLWDTAIQKCEVYENNPKRIVRGVDCGGLLGFYVFVAVWGYVAGGKVVAAMIRISRSRGARGVMGKGR